jgi:WD40 repeat protein
MNFPFARCVSLGMDPEWAVGALGLADGSIRIFDFAGAKDILRIEGHGGSIWRTRLSWDSRSVLCNSAGGTRLWELGSILGSREIREQNRATLAFTPDGKRSLAVAGGGTVQLWDLVEDKVVLELRGHTDQVMHGGISPDGRTAVTAAVDGTVCAWDLVLGAKIDAIEANDVSEIAMGREGRLVVLAGYGCVRLWRPGGGAAPEVLDVPHCTAVAVCPGDRTLVFGTSAGEVVVWDLEGKRERFRMQGHGDIVESVACDAKGEIVVSGSYDWTLRVWDLRTGTLLRILAGHTGRVFPVVVDEEGRLALSGSLDRTARVWDIRTGKELRRLEGHRGTVRRLGFGEGGRTVLTGSPGQVFVTDLYRRDAPQDPPGSPEEFEPFYRSVALRVVAEGSERSTIKPYDPGEAASFPR